MCNDSPIVILTLSKIPPEPEAEAPVVSHLQQSDFKKSQHINVFCLSKAASCLELTTKPIFVLVELALQLQPNLP